MFSHSVRTSSSARASIASAIRIKRQAALEGVERFHEPKASLDESSARSMSSGEDTGASANASPVLGSTSGAVFPPADLTCSPWIKLCNSRTGTSPESDASRVSLACICRESAQAS